MARVSKETTEKRLKWYDHVKCSEEGHVLRRMVDAQYQERDAEDDGKSGIGA